VTTQSPSAEALLPEAGVLTIILAALCGLEAIREH
jgi:hypothetical protein